MSMDFTENELAAVLAALFMQEQMLEATEPQASDPLLHTEIMTATRSAQSKCKAEYVGHFGGSDA